MRTEPQRTSLVALSLWRLSLIATSIAMIAAGAHLMELPPKMQYEPALWVKLHRTLYTNFGRIGGPAEVIAVVSTGLLAWTRRRSTHARRPAIVAAACLIAMHAVYWSIVQPVNVEVLRWSLDAIPRDWTKWRDQWEYGHAVRAGLVAAAFAVLALSRVWVSGTAFVDDPVS